MGDDLKIQLARRTFDRADDHKRQCDSVGLSTHRQVIISGILNYYRYNFAELVGIPFHMRSPIPAGKAMTLKNIGDTFKDLKLEINKLPKGYKEGELHPELTDKDTELVNILVLHKPTSANKIDALHQGIYDFIFAIKNDQAGQICFELPIEFVEKLKPALQRKASYQQIRNEGNIDTTLASEQLEFFVAQNAEGLEGLFSRYNLNDTVISPQSKGKRYITIRYSRRTEEVLNKAKNHSIRDKVLHTLVCMANGTT